MKNIFKIGLFALVTAFAMTSCDPQDGDDHSLGVKPQESQLSFTATPGSNPNVVTLKNISSLKGLVVTWDLGNGVTAKGEEVVASYPFANTYTIAMTAYNTGGSTTITQTITIANNDESQIEPKAIILAGGLTGSKTWVFDRAHDGHFGVGPGAGNPDYNGTPSWWSCPAEGKAECALYENEFSFHLDGGYNMTWVNKGKIYTNGAGKDKLPGVATVPGAGDFDVEYIPKEAYTFTVDGDKLKLSDDAFFGHFAGTSTYTIKTLNENELYLECSSAVESGNGWWYRFVPKK